ncbi:hypothetical protein ACQPZF_40640 [Actinosynnema sp. CS-041913]|uniref:hypothetical protein n=1 Tax=Actinosynnema sp. CS-041913 TaxID=3239917 RepID=UPI003D9461AA
MTDIKQTLENAFDDEPPLNLDTNVIMRAARRKVQIRRSASAVAAFATVAAVCVPALVGSSGQGGGVQVASPPLSTVATVPSSGSTPPATTPPSTSQSNVRPTFDGPVPTGPITAEHAAELDGLLVKAGVPQAYPAVGVPGNPKGAWEFASTNWSEYKADAELIGPPRGTVSIRLAIQPFGCGIGKWEHIECEVRQFEGKTVMVVEFDDGTTQKLGVGMKTPDGGLFIAEAANTASGTTGGAVPLTYEQLAKIATLPGVTF